MPTTILFELIPYLNDKPFSEDALDVELEVSHDNLKFVSEKIFEDLNLKDFSIADKNCNEIPKEEIIETIFQEIFEFISDETETYKSELVVVEKWEDLYDYIELIFTKV